MADNSSIEWTDASWNPTRGCSKVSAGCAYCYAERMAARFSKPGEAFDGTITGKHWSGVVKLVPEALAIPLKWKRPRRIFVDSMSDLFHDGVPDEYIAAVFGVMAAARRHTFQVLTKRPERARDWFAKTAFSANGAARECAFQAHYAMDDDEAIRDTLEPAFTALWPLPNVWLGVSVEDQRAADERIPLLLQIPAAVRFLSCEPLIGRVSIRGAALGYAVDRPADCARCGRGHGFSRCPNYGSIAPARVGKQHGDAIDCPEFVSKNGIGWVIVGGESGPKARPMNTAWAARLVQDAKDIGAKVYVKQMGAQPVAGAVGFRPGGYVDVDEPTTPLALKSKKGNDPAEWPESLRVREFPS